MKKLSFVLLLGFLLACHEETKLEEAIVHQNDFESMLGWSDVDPGRLMKGLAHSGNYSTLTDSMHPYSLGFIRKLKEISDRPIKRIDMSAWVLTKSLDAKAGLVLSIESGGKPQFYKGINVLDSIQATQKWYVLRCRFDLPSDLSMDNEVRMYLWNTGKDTVLADDFEIKFYTQ